LEFPFKKTAFEQSLPIQIGNWQSYDCCSACNTSLFDLDFEKMVTQFDITNVDSIRPKNKKSPQRKAVADASMEKVLKN
jgi:hypothetical protein